MKKFILSIFFLFFCHFIYAENISLTQRVSDLETKVKILEELIAEQSKSNNWKDPIFWRKIKKEMLADDVKIIIGKPHRIEEQIFVTWYYHPSSKLHSYVWFDEGKVLGWKTPD